MFLANGLFVRSRDREGKAGDTEGRVGDPERNNSASVLIVKRPHIAWLCHERAVRN